MLYGQVLSETADAWLVRIESQAGDAPDFGLYGDLTLPKANVRRMPDRDGAACFLAPLQLLKQLGRASNDGVAQQAER